MATPTTPALEPVRGLSRKESAVQEIKRGIVTGAITPGQKLTELELAKTLEVSRPTIREALMQLTREGILVQEPYKGMHVAEVSPDEILHLAMLRESLDLMALDQIYADKTDEKLSIVADAWEEFRDLELHADPLVRHEAHIAFHRQVLMASESSILLGVIPVVEGLMTIALAIDVQFRPNAQTRGHSIHKEYVEAILSRKVLEARKAIHKHTIGSAQEVAEMLERNAK